METIYTIETMNDLMASSDRATSIPVHASTVRLLQQLKTGAQNWDQFLLELAERDLDRLEADIARADLALFRAGKGELVPLSAVRREFQTKARK